MNNKNIIRAGVAAIGIYLFSQVKKSIPATHARYWWDMTPAERATYIRRTTLTTMAEKIKALKEAIKQKSTHENTPLGKTTLTSEEREAVLRALEAKKEAEKEQGTGFDYVRERAPLNKAIPIRSKKIARKIPSVGTSAARRRMAQKIEETRNRKIREQRAAAARKAAASHIYSGTKTTHNPYRSSFPATGPKNIVHTTSTRQRTAQKIAKKVVAPWKAPLVWSPKPNFRVITPSDILRNLAKKDIARKKAIEQKKVQKTTHSTPSARRKKRLEALYGSHWHDIWVERQKR